MSESNRDAVEPDREAIDAGGAGFPAGDDFAEEHDQTSTDDDEGEPESPRGHSGLEPTDRPN